MEIDRGRPNSKTKREQTSNFDAASYSLNPKPYQGVHSLLGRACAHRTGRILDAIGPRVMKVSLEAQVPIDSTNLYRDLRTGTQYIANWASRVLLLTA